MRHPDALLAFGLIVASGATVAIAISPWVLIGFMFGVTTCLGAAVIASTSFE